MNKIKIPPKLIYAIIIGLIVIGALLLRVLPPYSQVFTPDWIKFTGIDAYYHMRIVDNVAHNFPNHMTVDPYFAYPVGSGLLSINFFQWLLSFIIWVVGLGSPTQHTIDVVGVYFPAVLGALTVIPVYFISKELLGRWAGVVSALLIAILPGEFLGRSILGSTDNHVAETLFTTVTMLFLILAVKSGRQKALTFSHIKQKDWATSVKPVIYSVLAGVFLGIYILTWLGALLFVFLITVWFIIQFFIDHLKGKSVEYLGLVGFIVFLSTLIVVLPTHPGAYSSVSLTVALLVPLVLSAVSLLMTSRKIKPIFYPLTSVILGLIGLGVFFAVNPSLLKSMIGTFGVFFPSAASRTTMEVQALLFPAGSFSLGIAWGNFTTGFYLTLFCLIVLIYSVIKRGNPEKSILVVWSLIILAATLSQRRFAYYFAVNVAVLTGYISCLILSRVGFKEFGGEIDEAASQRGGNLGVTQKLDYYAILGVPRNATDKEIKKAFQKLEFKYHDSTEPGKMEEIRKAYRVLSDHRQRAGYDHSQRGTVKKVRGEIQKGGFRITTSHINFALAIIITFLVVFVPDIVPAVATASEARFAPSDAWCSSLTWLKDNSPDPFGNPNLYYEPTTAPAGEGYPYPESAYGVMSWWDYGYWITRIARRMPYANPSQGSTQVGNTAQFFLSQNESSAQPIIQDVNTRYVIIDYEAATSKFWAIATWAGKQPSEFFDTYFVPQEDGTATPYILFHPEYYRSLSARLYNFDGKAVTPNQSIVIAYQKVTTELGQLNKITGVEQFNTYEEAEVYRLAQSANSTSNNYRIIGVDPLVSPVPLEATEQYQLVHSSDNISISSGVGSVSAVKIFEYIGDREAQ